jgi:hypothetical protein
MAEELDEFGIPVRNSKPTVDEFGIPLKKKVALAPGGYGSQLGSQTFQPTKAFVPTPLIGAGVQDFQKQEARRQAAAEKLSNKLQGQQAAYYSAQGEQGFANVENAKLQSDYNQLQAVIQKDLGNKGNDFSITYNKLLQGTGSMISGAIDAGLNGLKYSGITPFVSDATIIDYRANIAPEVKTFLKETIGADVDKGAERKYDENFVTGAIGGLAYSVPAMVTPFGIGLYSQAYDSGLDLINSTPAGKNLTEDEKTLFAGTLGAVVGRIEKFGLNRTLGRTLSSELANGLAFKAINELSKKGGAKITSKAIGDFAEASLRGTKNRLLNSADQGYRAVLDEFSTGALQEGSTIGLEQVTNKLKDKDIFDTQDMGEMFGRVLKSAAAEGLGGGILGTAKGGLLINTKNHIVNKISEAKSFDDVRNLLLNVEQIGQENNYTPEEIQEVVTTVNDIVQKKEKLPQDLNPAQTSGIVGLMIDRDELTDNLKDLEVELNNTDDALKPVKAGEIELVKKQIAAVNTKMAEIAQNPEYAIQKPSTTSQVPPVIEGGQNIQEGGERVGQRIEGTQAPQEVIIQEPTAAVNQEEVARLRAEEQQEIAEAIPNIEEYKVDGKIDRGLMAGTEDLKKYDAIYDKYDKLITPLLPQKTEQIGIAFAPYREKNVATLPEDEQIRNSEEYKLHQENVINLAGLLGIPVSKKIDTWGGYVDSETGRPVQEVSNVIEVNATPEQAEVMAAILGKAAPEMQDSILVGSYNPQGNGTEHVIKTGSFENASNAIQYLKENGIEYFTIDKNNGDIIILDFDNSIPENIINFVNKLNQNGIETEHEVQAVEAKLIGNESYDSILSQQRGKIIEQTGFDIDSFIGEARKRFEEIKSSQEAINAKQEVVKARGKVNKTNALARLKDVATEEEFQTFLEDNPRFNKYVEGGPEQKKLGASRIVGEAIQPEEFTEFEEVPNEDAEAMLRDSIETPFRNKEKLDKTSKSLVSRIIRAAFDSQYEVIQKLLKQGGDIGKITVATLKNRKGYNGMASIKNRQFNKDIFNDLSFAPNIQVAGRKTSERELFDTFLNLNRIINIDARIRDKFSQLVQVDRKIKEGIKNNSLNKEQLAELTKEKEILEDYLDNRKALRTVNGEYVPVQYLHSGGRTAASARAELAVLKSAIPDVYEKLNKSYDAYTDAFRFLLDEQFNNGMISKSVYDELFSYNYIPTKYIQHFIENELSQDNPVLASKLSSTIKNLTGGSDSDVITNFQAILELYTNSVYKRIYENRAAKSLAKSVRDTGEQSKSLMKTNQLVKDADAKLSKQPMYNVNLDMYIQEPTGEDKFGNPTYGDVPTGYDVIYFYDANGKRERVVASKDFVDTWYDRGGLLSPKGEEYLSGISKWSGVNLFKSLITKNNPAFGIYQILQDAPQALIATKAYPDFILGSFQLASDYATVSKDIIKFVKNDEVTPLFKEAIDAGIFSDFLSTENDILRSQTLVNSDGSTNYKTTAKALKNRIGKAVNSTLDSIAQTNEAIEYLTRLAVYKRMKQNLVAKYTKENGGVEPTENQMFDIQQLAAQEARNVVDFSRSGTIIKPLNKVFAYLNAGIQAFYSSARSLKNNPTKAAVLLTEIGIGGVAVMAMSLGAYGDDKEKKKRLAKYMMLSKYQKANYFNIYNPYTDDPEMEWIRIPKPQPFRGFINLLEQGYLHNVMDVDINMKQAQEAFSNDVPLEPSLLDLLTRNPLINATVKYSMNKDVFRNQDVVKNAEKIEDWAEGIDDENVSKLYKQLGKSTKDLLGGEGISPKRAQAFSQSLIGDPSRNTTTAVLDKFGKSLFYIINGDQKGLDEEFGDRTVADNIFKLTGLKGRLFSKTPKMDSSFMEGLDEQRRELFTKRLLIRSEIEDIYNTADSKQEATKLVNERLNELVKNKDITPQYKKKIIASESKKDILKDKPSWYKSLLYSESNDEKVQILKHYTEGMSNDEYKKAAMFLLQNKIISPEVTKEFAIVRNKK